ncbi:MAG TPA: hypothetical protein PKA58_20880 [Polyangium sp.]|nr:hypothetical protein [Polyangium sp.]
MQTRQWLGLVAGLAGLMWTAQVSAQNVAAAIEIFNRAVTEYDQKDYVAACRDFAESQRLAPQPGTMFRLAKCEEDAGLIASASAHYLEFLAEFRALSEEKQVKYQERAVEAEQKRAEFAAVIPTLTLRLPANAPEQVEILHHKTHVSAAMLGIALPVDPGEHVVTTQVPNGPVHEHRFAIERNDKKEIILVVDLPPPPPVSLVGKANVREQPSNARTGGLVLLGVGVAGLVGFAVTGGVAYSKKTFVDENCPAKRCPDASGLETWNEAKALANLTSVGLGVSGALSVLGLILVGSSSSGPAKTESKDQAFVVDVDSRRAWFGWKGAF